MPAVRAPISAPSRLADSYTPMPRPVCSPDASAMTACWIGMTAAQASPLRIHSAAMTTGFGAQASPAAKAALANDAHIRMRVRPKRTT
ncbi:hypothetical protein SMD44_08288 [Streptomyces alboflavus]|uniref:Uncharacterized protein n=1 Tax=Streptomyces alboflavus TaxID=67267 RepID=A0A1Z1WQR7_9ACTN|nr:hypothetical protein SMD44_08288 [Streptomyces alboflavus]